MSPASRGFHIGVFILVGLGTKPGAGFLSDRLRRKQVLVPGLAWSCLAALLLIPFDTGISLTIAVALMGLFRYPDQPVLTAAVFDLVGREVSATGLGGGLFRERPDGHRLPPYRGSVVRNGGFRRNRLLHRIAVRHRGDSLSLAADIRGARPSPE